MLCISGCSLMTGKTCSFYNVILKEDKHGNLERCINCMKDEFEYIQDEKLKDVMEVLIK